MNITTNIEETFLNALEEVVIFVKDEESETNELCPAFRDELRVHGLSFLYRAWCYYIAENENRISNNKLPKTIDCLAHDFFFTACGHGVGFWEKSESDWLYHGEQLEQLAKCYFYAGYSVSGNDGFLIGG